MSAKFIVIEGLDGSGKSTQAKMLAQKLTNSLLTREPTDESIGSLCRAAFSNQLVLNHASITLLLVADRIEHLEKKIVPALEAKRDVVCDRYYLSNMAYQANSEQEMQEIYILNKKFNVLQPDLTIFLSLEPKIALERIQLRSLERGIFDDLQTLEKINENYQSAIAFLRSQGENVIEISALPTEDEIAIEVLEAVQNGVFSKTAPRLRPVLSNE